MAEAGGGAYFFLMGEAPAKGESPAHAERHIMTLDPFLVNLADKDSRRYLKVKLDLEVPNEKAAKELEKSLPRLRDATILLLSSKSYADISTSEGKLQLKQQLLQQMTGLPGGKKIHGVFFTEFVAQ